MPDSDKGTELFEIINNKQKTGSISKQELADGITNIIGDESFRQKAVAAGALVSHFPTQEEGYLDAAEFQQLTQQMVDQPDGICDGSWQTLAELLVLQVVFADKRESTEQTDAMDTIITTSPEQQREEGVPQMTTKKQRTKEIKHAMKDTRMQALFDVFDENSTGVVDFQQIVVGLYKAMDGIDAASHAAAEALLLFDDTEKRELFYHDFAKLILSIAALQFTSFDDLMDSLTRNAIRVSSGVTADFVMEQFSMDKASKLLLGISNDEESNTVSMSVLELAKIDRLFAMFDSDHDEKINAAELTLGLAKFHQTTGMDTTAEESTQVIKAFDRNHDGKLGHHEFSTFIVNFASTANMQLLDLLDFMIVVMALKENTDAQQEYTNSMDISAGRRTLDIRYG